MVVSTLELARAETSMDVAVLGEIHDGREVVRLLAGEAESFGLAIGGSLPVEETFCQRLLEGRLRNVVADAISDERVCDLEATRAAGIGAYIGVPMTTLDARLYILCCLAHEQRPALGERDVRVPPRPRRDDHPGAGRRAARISRDHDDGSQTRDGLTELADGL